MIEVTIKKEPGEAAVATLKMGMHEFSHLTEIIDDFLTGSELWDEFILKEWKNELETAKKLKTAMGSSIIFKED